MNEVGKSRVLIVDHAPDRERLLESLAMLPVHAFASATAEAAIACMNERRPDLLICEIRLPDASGFSLCRRLREQPETQSMPVILTSSWASEMDRILAFECGADDFVAKPFYARELASRVCALLRRGRSEITEPARREAADGLPRASATEAVLVDDRIVSLTPKEQSILAALVAGGGHVLTRSELIASVWGDQNVPSPRGIDAHVKSLRRKLGRAADAVSTVRGLGYRFKASPHLHFD